MRNTWPVDDKREDPENSLFCTNVDSIEYNESFHVPKRFPFAEVHAVSERKYYEGQEEHECEEYLDWYEHIVHLERHLGSMYYLNVHNDGGWHQENACKNHQGLHCEPYHCQDSELELFYIILG